MSENPKINLNCRDDYNRTPLYLASWTSNIDIVQSLLKIENIDATIPDSEGLQPIHAAASNGHNDVIDLLIKHGIDINVRSASCGHTPIFQACVGGHLRTIKWLIKAGANIQLTTSRGRSLLHDASYGDDPSVIQFLLELGFDVNRQDNIGVTPLYQAAITGNATILAQLIRAGADPRLPEEFGYTPLHVASDTGHTECLSLLIPVSYINAQAQNKRTALMSACFRGNEKSAALLLQAGADTTNTDTSGYDALGLAAEGGFDECILLLLRYQAKVFWGHNKSALKLAQQNGHDKVIRLLLDYKDNPWKYESKHEEVAAPALSVLDRDTTTVPGSKMMRKDSTKSTCPVYKATKEFIKDMNLPAGYFDHAYDVCFCGSCHTSRGDNLYYTRGDPPQDYGLPIGWCKFGLKIPARAFVIGALDKWHVAFHGTRVPNVEKILRTGDLLMPGDVTPGGAELRPPRGHFDPEAPGKEPPKGFDISKIYLSPSIRWKSVSEKSYHHLRVAFQVRVEPGTYEVGPETIGAGDKQIDPRFSNKELEWSTKRRGVTFLVGLLVKVEGMGGEPGLDWSTQVAAATPAHPQPGYGIIEGSVSGIQSGLVGKLVKLLYPFTYPISPGVDITLSLGDTVTILSELEHGHLLVKVPTIKQPFVIPRNFLHLADQ